MHLPYSFIAPKLVFQHVPKTAGTTVNEYISSYLDKSQICPLEFDSLILQENYESLNKYFYFPGHYSRNAVSYIPGQKFVFTFLRDPIATLKSLYKYWKSHTFEFINKHPERARGPKLAKENSFKEFIFIDNIEISTGFDNSFCKQFSGLYQSEMESLQKNNQSEVAINMCKKHLDSMYFIGFQDNFDEDFEILLNKLRLPVVKPFPKKNTSSNFDSVLYFENVDVDFYEGDTEVMKRLEKFTELDYEVYNYAKKKSSAINDPNDFFFNTPL